MNFELFSQLLNLFITGRCIYIISYGNVVIYNFALVLTVEVSKYFVTTEVEYLAWSTEMEWSFIWEILIDMN